MKKYAKPCSNFATIGWMENAGTENAGTGKCRYRYWNLAVLKMLVLENDGTGKCQYSKIMVVENASTGVLPIDFFI